MEFTLENGRKINLPKKTDTILEQETNGRVKVECIAKNGKASYDYYYDYNLLVKEKGKNAVVKAWNYLERTFAVNAVNVPVKEGSKVKAQFKADRNTFTSKEQKDAYDSKVAASLAAIMLEMQEPERTS